MVQYWYDAWGNHKVVDSNGNAITNANHIGNLNPFRYRGYYFDRETGLYFLQTRYYDPEIGRFLNRDSVAYADPQTINGLNLYAYCLNNPVAYVDPTGHSVLIFLTAAAIGFAVSFGSSVLTQAAFNNGQINWLSALTDGIFGAISGALFMVPGLGAGLTGIINAGLSFVNMTLTTGIESNWSFTAGDWVAIGLSSITSGITSGISRASFLRNDGKFILRDSHRQVGNIISRLKNGYYFRSGSAKVAKRSINSAKQSIKKTITNLNFGEGFWRDWLLTVTSSVYSTSLIGAFNELI